MYILVEKGLKIYFVNMVFKRTSSKKIIFHAFLLGNVLNKFQFEIVKIVIYNLWTVKLFYLN
jgi:hypothetical protein